MKEEILRMDRVTCGEQGVTELNHFCLNLYAGQIMGLITVNDTGLEALLKLLTQNQPIHYGYIYYRGRLVNQWRQSDYSYNRIGVIQTKSGLADDLTVADNVFVMRHGFKKRLIQRKVLEEQLKPFLDEIGVHLSADAAARDLSPYHRMVTEIVKAVVADCRLIVLIEPDTVIGDERLDRLHQIMRHYADKGFSFLYVSKHYEETAQVCQQAALMLNGQIVKVLSTQTTPSGAINCFGVEKYNKLIKGFGKTRFSFNAALPALELKALQFGRIEKLDIKIMPGECVVLQDMNNYIFDDLIRVLNGEKRPQQGEIRVNGTRYTRASQRKIAVIDKTPTQSMIFAGMSYMDNLCFTMDHLLPGVWRGKRTFRSIRKEWSPILGDGVFDMPVESLSRKEKYDLVYTRVMLQRPCAAVCVQPFMHADVEHRMRIWTLMERLLNRGISVVILAVNLADSLAFADRLIRVRNGRVLAEFKREDFGALPESTPWHELWSAGRLSSASKPE